MWVCDIESKHTYYLISLDDYKWTKTPIDEEDQPLARYGHTSVVKDNEIFIYGGNLDKYLFKPKEDIIIFDTSNIKI